MAKRKKSELYDVLIKDLQSQVRMLEVGRRFDAPTLKTKPVPLELVPWDGMIDDKIISISADMQLRAYEDARKYYGFTEEEWPKIGPGVLPAANLRFASDSDNAWTRVEPFVVDREEQGWCTFCDGTCSGACE